MFGVISSGEEPFSSGTLNNAAYAAVSALTNSEEYPQVTLLGIIKGYYILYGFSFCPEYSDSQKEALAFIHSIVINDESGKSESFPVLSDNDILIEDLKMVVRCPENSIFLSRGMNAEDLSDVFDMTTDEVDEILISSGEYLDIFDLNGNYTCYISASDFDLAEDISFLSDDALISYFDAVLSGYDVVVLEPPTIFETADSSGKYIKGAYTDESQSEELLFFATFHNFKLIKIDFSFSADTENVLKPIIESIINSIRYY